MAPYKSASVNQTDYDQWFCPDSNRDLLFRREPFCPLYYRTLVVEPVYSGTFLVSS